MSSLYSSGGAPSGCEEMTLRQFLLTYTLTAHVNETTINKEIVNGRVRT